MNRPRSDSSPSAVRCENERGSITAFVVVMASAFILLGGLIYDAGLAMAGKTAAIDEAQQAARAAAHAISPTSLRDNAITIDPAEAVRYAQSYIAACGDTGTVHVRGNQITVIVAHRQRTQILGAIGLHAISVSGSATIDIEQGIVTSKH